MDTNLNPAGTPANAPHRATWQGDRDYHDRHQERSLRRARCIEQHLTGDCTFLDVGCNRGLTSSYLLSRGKVARATGIELAQGAVADDLLRDERFSFLSGDICDIALTGTYDAIFYGAVHHHIVRERGLATAIGVLQKLVDHCSHQLFFETGHLTEGSRWAWQRELRKYFRTDEEHIFFLLRHIEPRIRAVEVIGQFPIHLSLRWLLRIEVEPLSRHPLSYPRTTNALCERKLRWQTRTFGSQNQQWRDLTPGEIAFVEFGETTDLHEPRLFIKRRPLARHVDEDEYLIATSVQVKHVVQPLRLEPTLGIVYPFVDGVPILDWIRKNKRQAPRIAAAVLEAFRDARNQEAPPTRLLLGGARRKLVDVVDMSPNNFLVSDTPSGPVLHWIDLERQSAHYSWKNCLHVANLLVRIRGYRRTALLLLLKGIATALMLLVRYQLVGPGERIVARQPSLASLVVTAVRSGIGRLVIRAAPSLSRL